MVKTGTTNNIMHHLWRINEAHLLSRYVTQLLTGKNAFQSKANACFMIETIEIQICTI